MERISITIRCCEVLLGMIELDALLQDPDYSSVTSELESLRELNVLAFNVMSLYKGYPGRKYSDVRYRKLQKTYSWKPARDLNVTIRLKLYGKLICDYCHEDIEIKPGNKGFVMHHEIYNWRELYTNNLIMFVHYNCHKELHAK